MHQRQKILLNRWEWVILLIMPIFLAACNSTPNVDWELTISGDVNNPITLSYKELVAMPQVKLNDLLMEKTRGEDEIRSFSGVELIELLELAQAPENFSSITAKAADGYAIEITRDEVKNAIVALKDGNEWIIEKTPDDGALRLVTPTTPANRWVFQLVELVVNQ